MRLSIILGPYRNLTTLTAAILSLHPDCQVLNHAGNRFMRNPQFDFMTDLSGDTLNRFMDAAQDHSSARRRQEV